MTLEYHQTVTFLWTNLIRKSNCKDHVYEKWRYEVTQVNLKTICFVQDYLIEAEWRIYASKT